MHGSRPTPRRRGAPVRRALLIDAFGTLVTLAAPAPRLQAALRDQLGVVIAEPQARAALAAEITYYRAHMGEGRDPASLHALRLECADVLRAGLPRSAALDRATRDAILEVLLASLRFDAFTDARPALQHLRATRPELRIVAVSNWDVSVLEVLELTGLAPLLDGAVCSAAVGAAKPAAAIFRHALGLVGVAPDHAIHVGDTLAEDVVGARASGIGAVLLHRDGGRPDSLAVPDDVPVIAGLDELDA